MVRVLFIRLCIHMRVFYLHYIALCMNHLIGVRNRRDGTRGSVFWFAIPYLPDEQSAAFQVTPTLKLTSFLPTLNLTLTYLVL